jgi:hypothetical protein
VTLGESLLRVIPGHEVEPVVGSVRTIPERDPQSSFGFVNGGRCTAGAPPVAADAGGENAADQDGRGDQHGVAVGHANATGKNGIGAAGDVMGDIADGLGLGGGEAELAGKLAKPDRQPSCRAGEGRPQA